jgi:tetratricopeptide (TPR) repeat protein/predicted Ser/Thr protein kinase
MGTVYLATDLGLGRLVAIKFITPEKAADPAARKRLLREARAAAALDHPNICSVYEVIDEPDGRACIVMQYVSGDTLADTLARGPLDVRLTMSLARDLASALALAHKHGIVHRDLKPHNIIITNDKRAKLLDFGLARQNDGVLASAGEAVTTTALTTPGVVVGTPAYMSPEQIRQVPIDGRSDLFSLGAVLYECLTGERAFRALTPLEYAGQILHCQPPDVSSRRTELTVQHDELCRRLLAKDPEDRFQSAEELLGALRVFTPDTGRTSATGFETHWPAALWSAHPSVMASVGIAVTVILATAGVWRWKAVAASAPTAEAAAWYSRGTTALRDGAYHSGQLALREAIRAAPDYPAAYIRMAEADTELGEVEGAQQALLKVSDLVTSESRLPFGDRKRTQAIRALMLRDVDGAVRAYAELAASEPRDPGAWLDLGRAQDSAALSADARASYERALQMDAQYAPAHLRRASILGLEGRRDEALAGFAEAERLYRAAANVEGEVETLIRLGAFLISTGEGHGARVALERADDLAAGVQSRAQQIRAELTLSSVTAFEGRWDDAENMASAAVEAALREHLDRVAADGLVDLANVLTLRRRHAEADAYLVRAIEIANRRGAQRIVARATLQRAAILVDEGHSAEGITAAKAPLDYFQANHYRRYELVALSVISRAQEALAHYADARQLAERSLALATEIKDEVQAAQALENLAGEANALGALPDALQYRARGLDIHRRQNDLSSLSFDLVNRADLLIRLGRYPEGAALLDELDAGIAKGLDAYKPRERRAGLLRALAAAIQHRLADVARLARPAAAPVSEPNPNTSAQLAATLLEYAQPNTGQRGSRAAAPLPDSLSPSSRELRYWTLLTRLARRDARGALEGAEQTLATPDGAVSYEFEWRIAALAGAAARELHDAARQQAFVDRAQRAETRLRQEWKSDVASYEARPDLMELRRIAGLH